MPDFLSPIPSQDNRFITDPDMLKDYGIKWDTDTYPAIKQVIKKFPLKITPYYLSLAASNKLNNDPILLQCLPDAREIINKRNFSNDPLHEDFKHSPVPKLIRRYPDRAVIIATNKCAVFCRHCNRKRFWNNGNMDINKKEIEKIVLYLKAKPKIRDVIISGGDPLILDHDILEEILWQIQRIKTIDIIRIGSRVPVTMPMRITKELCKMIAQYGPVWLNTQFNSPMELTRDAAAACNNLLMAGIPVNNQSVLIKGVNDSLETMKKLLRGLLKIKVRPYYLFHCEPVDGIEHLRTPVIKGVEIISSLYSTCSGLGIPRYVIDVPSGAGKVPIGLNYIIDIKPGTITLKTPGGATIEYPDAE